MSEPPPRYVEPIATRLRERPAKPPAVDLAGHDAQEGTCHKCGGLMLRGRPDDARLCGKCGTRYHASDCGKRLHACGLMEKAEMCPKVRVTARAARRSTRGRSLPDKSPFARVFLPPPPTRALTERRRAHPSQCHGLCSCSGGPIRCHVTVMRVSRLSRSRDEAEGAVFDGDGGGARRRLAHRGKRGRDRGFERAGGRRRERAERRQNRRVVAAADVRAGWSFGTRRGKGHARRRDRYERPRDLGIFRARHGGRDGGRSGRRTVDTIAVAFGRRRN